MCLNFDICFVFIFRCDVIMWYGIDCFCVYEFVYNVNIFEYGGYVFFWVYCLKDLIFVDFSK